MNKIQKVNNKYLKEAQIQIKLKNLSMKEIALDKHLQKLIIKTILKILKNNHNHINYHQKIQKIYKQKY